MGNSRNHQLDGWRAIAVLGVMWLHWAPPAWRGGIPFEIGLYFFLTLTGFLITRILLRDRDRGESTGGPWGIEAFRAFQFRRALRILVPCYAAMCFGLLVGAQDIRENPWVYFAHLSNFHIALLQEWPHGTSHYWTLAIQQQFYLFWPVLIYLVPRGCLLGTLLVLVSLAPASRAVLAVAFPQVFHPGAITTCAFDYLGCGALLAWSMHRGELAGGGGWLRVAAWLCLPVYGLLYTLDWVGRPVPVLGHFQQTFLSVSMVGLIASTLQGFPDWRGRVLESSMLQHVAKISYSLYLFHCLVPMALGWVLPGLWAVGGGLGEGLRLGVFFAASWGVAWLSWWFLERPLERMRARKAVEVEEG
ncbi:MAG: acyltransferase family protein [Verrucomicrobiales bacterium]